MFTRRAFGKLLVKGGMAAATSPLWLDGVCAKAFAQLSSAYKAIVLVSLGGGNDGNNTLIPLDSATYRQYSGLRTSLAIPQASCNVLTGTSGAPVFGLHPALKNVASLYNQGLAAFVTNIGPITKLATKSELVADPSVLPPALFSHPEAIVQWESASTEAYPSTGWGGRMADLLASQSGSLPPLIDTGGASIFMAGRSVQAVSVIASGKFPSAIPAGLQSAMVAIANQDATSQNQIVAQAAKVRAAAFDQQAMLAQATASGNSLKTNFPQSGFGQSMQTIASIINGRSVVGASRQIFYVQQGVYDTHADQLGAHTGYLTDLDAGLGAFMSALQEMGLANQVLVCTHSDFNRTMLANTEAGSDHAWGNHQLILGGGIRGARVIGTYPDLDLGGSMDLNGYGTWIPTLAPVQMAAGIGAWMGLSQSDIASTFPELANFPSGPITLT